MLYIWNFDAAMIVCPILSRLALIDDRYLRRLNLQVFQKRNEVCHIVDRSGCCTSGLL